MFLSTGRVQLDSLIPDQHCGGDTKVRERPGSEGGLLTFNLCDGTLKYFFLYLFVGERFVYVIHDGFY